MYKSSYSITNIQNSFAKILNDNLNLLQKDLKKNKKLSWFIPFIKVVKRYADYILVLFVMMSLYFSEQVINIFELFLLFDSIIISLLVLKNNNSKYHPRRLAKNIISLFVLYTNFTGSLASIIIFFLIYFEFNKFINKIIYQIIDQIIGFLSYTLPFIKDIYPNLKLIDHNKGIESTEMTGNSDSSDSESVVTDSSDSDSSDLDGSKLFKSNSVNSHIFNNFDNTKILNLSHDSNSDSDSDSIIKNNDSIKTIPDNSGIKFKKKYNQDNEYKMYNKIIKNIDKIK